MEWRVPGLTEFQYAACDCHSWNPNLDPRAIISSLSRDSTASYNWRLSPTRKRHYGPGKMVAGILELVVLGMRNALYGPCFNPSKTIARLTLYHVTNLNYSKNEQRVPLYIRMFEIDYWNIQIEYSKIRLKTRKQK